MTSPDRLRELSGRFAAEFAIVVLGVTLALWADGWVSDRAERDREVARLEGLRDNISRTLANLRADQENAAGGADALREIVSLDGQNIVNAELIDLLRYGVLFGSDFSPELNVYDDLKNSGELALLRSPRLRQALAKMESQLKLVALAQADMTTIQQLYIDSFAIENLDLRLIYGSDVGLEPDPPIDPSGSELVFDRKTRNRLLLKLDLVTYLQSRLDEAEAALVTVQDAIASQR